MKTQREDRERTGGGQAGSGSPDPVPAYRAAMTPDQLDVIDAIWAHYLSTKHGEWPPKRQINVGGPGRGRVLAALDALPPGSWFEEAGNTPRYALTFLGVLLTRHGEEIEDLTARFLEYMRSELVKPVAPSRLTADAVGVALALTPAELIHLGRIILFAGFYGESFSGGEQWSAGMPGDADELTEVEDLHRYVRNRAMERAASASRWTPSSQLQPQDKQRRGDFWFIEDITLRKQLAADRQELIAVHGTGALKSTVILAGGLLEGMLLDALTRRSEEARSTYARLRQKRAERIDRWVLGDLIEVATDLSILSGHTFHVSHVLREFRDLVHPGRQLRERIKLTSDDANLAVSAVGICFRALAEFAARQERVV